VLNGSNARDIALGVAAAAVIVGGAVWFDQSRGAPDPAPAVAAVPETETATPVADAPNGSTEQTADAPVEAADEPIVATEEDSVAALDVATEAADVGPMAPSLDTFFRNPDETTIIAGRAAPGQVVAIMLGSEEVDRVEAAADGTFGTVVFISAADQPRRVRLIGDPDGTPVRSAESVIVPPAEPPVVAAAPQQDAPGDVTASADSGTAPSAVDDTDATVTAIADITDATAPEIDSDSPSAPTLIAGSAPVAAAPPTLIADSEGVRVLQRPDPETTKPAFVDTIALDTITYDTKGEVILAGRSGAGGFVQVYLDNQPITTSRISDTGDWQIDLPEVDTGVYTLRVDEVDDDGNVTSRIETPFKREERETVAAIMAEETSAEGFDVAVRTVQPGATLWAIAEEQFGAGILYVSVFEANRDQIRNPDLIYPGQVFRIPEIAE